MQDGEPPWGCQPRAQLPTAARHGGRVGWKDCACHYHLRALRKGCLACQPKGGHLRSRYLQVDIIDGTRLLQEMAAESEPAPKSRNRPHSNCPAACPPSINSFAMIKRPCSRPHACSQMPALTRRKF
eukprot:1156510-Pelagomonas_calceolata.AAC.5